MDLLEQASKKDKNFTEAYLQLATIYSDRDEFEAAAHFLDQGQASLSSVKTPALGYKIA